MGNIKPNFGNGLKRARKAAGYKTQQLFADKIYKSLDTIQNWEQGKTMPSMGDFIDLCVFFDCDADYLLDNISEKTHDMAFLCSETGLSENALNRIIKLNPQALRVLDALLQADSFFSFIDTISTCASFMGEQGNIIKAYMVSRISELGEAGDPYHLASILNPIVKAGGDLYPMYTAKAMQEAEKAFSLVVEQMKGAENND